MPYLFKVVRADNKYDVATSVIIFKGIRDKHHPMMWYAWEDFAYPGVRDILERDKTPMLALPANIPQLFDEPGMIFNI